MRLSAAPRHKNAGRPAEKDARGFLQYVRGRQCVFIGDGDCDGKIEAMHLDWAGDKGMGSKVSDRYAIPACQRHHALQHQKGWRTFLALMNLTTGDLRRVADFLWGRWPGRPAWEKTLAGGRITR